MKNLLRWACACAVLLLLTGGAFAQGYNYTLSWTNPASHVYAVALETAPATGAASDFQVPAWRPGRYYFQDYAASILSFSAQDAKGQPLAWSKSDAHTWRVQNPGEGAITIRYNVFANTMDAGSSMLSVAQAYFNPVNFFMHLRGDYGRPCTLTVASMPADWKAATALQRVPGKHHVFTAPDYHEFVDCPTVLSPSLKTLHSRIDGTDFYFHFQGEFKGGKEVEDAFQGNMGKLIAEEKAIFGEFPMSEYHFIYQLLPFNIGHAVEHKNSACFAMPATVAQSPQAIARLNSISAHEFFHLWNVKRIRPAAMVPYDYQREAYTSLQWFTEGVTDYYTSLCLTRAGLYTQESYYSILARNIQALESNPASRLISPAQSSMDSWLDRSDYFAPYARISYYTLGARLGMLLDLSLRARTKGAKSLDDVFAYLYQNYYKANKGLEEDAVQWAIEKISGQSFADLFKAHVAGTQAIDYAAVLSPVGLELVAKPIEGLTWELVGVSKSSVTAEGLFIESVVPGSDIEAAGLGENMLIGAVDGKRIKDWDAKDFFEKFKKPKTVEIEAFNEVGRQVVQLTWTGTHVPATYSIVPMEKATDAQTALRAAWLRSRQ